MYDTDYLDENDQVGDEEAFARDLAEVLDEAGADMFVTGQAVASVTTFAEAQMLTMNQGLVVRMDDGAEYQLTVVQSKAARA